MRRSSGRTWTISAAVAALLAAAAPPVSAGNPRVIGGGDDPGVAVAQSQQDVAVNGWKAMEAARLRVASLTVASLRLGARPAMPAPVCSFDCPPLEFSLESYARQQNTSFYCGPASAQVIINRTREYFFADGNGQDANHNYRKQSVIAGFMGTDANGSTAAMVRNGLNQYADVGQTGVDVPFTVRDDIPSGSDFHWAMVTATWILLRGAAVPVQMTLNSQHLASWASAAWWNNHRSAIVRHWISVYGYSGFWDGTNGPQLYFADSSGGYGGATGNFPTASKLLYNLNQANSARIVY